MPRTTRGRSREAGAACLDEVRRHGFEGAVAFVTVLAHLVDGGCWSDAPAPGVEGAMWVAIEGIAPSPGRLGPATLPLRLAAAGVADEIGRLMGEEADPTAWLVAALEDHASATRRPRHPGALLLAALRDPKATFGASLAAEVLAHAEGRESLGWDPARLRRAVARRARAAA